MSKKKQQDTQPEQVELPEQKYTLFWTARLVNTSTNETVSEFSNFVTMSSLTLAQRAATMVGEQVLQKMVENV